MKLSKFANLVKNGGRCAVLHVAGSGIWLSTGTAIYRATELPDMEGSEQVRTVLDMTADAWKKVYLTEDWPESVSNVLGLNLAPYAQGEQDTEKLKVAAAPNGLWCSACRCKVDGELIFYNEAYLAPLAEEIKKSEYIFREAHNRDMPYLIEETEYGSPRLLFPSEDAVREYQEREELKEWVRVAAGWDKIGRYTLEQLRAVKKILEG